MNTLQELAKEIRTINSDNGWNPITKHRWEDVDKMLSCTALIHTEVSEATEAIRHGDMENFVEELADTVIRCLDVAGGFTDDFDQVVLDKLNKNRNRAYRHGGKRA